MSEDTRAANAADPAANATEGGAQGDALEAKVHVETVNARLLRESQENKRKAQEYKSKLEEIEKTKLAEQGNYKELLEKERETATQWKRNAMRFRVEHAIESAAAKAGCVNPKALNKLGNVSLLEVDETTLEVSGIEQLIEEAKREHSYLFSSGRPPTINSASPSGPVTHKPMSAADVAKLPQDKKQAAWAKAFGGG